MKRRDLLLSLVAGTVGALLDPRRALVDSARPVWRTAMDLTPRLHGRRADVPIIDDPPHTDQPGHWTYTLPGGGVYDSRLDRFRCWLRAPSP
jgi:hypothetical protein